MNKFSKGKVFFRYILILVLSIVEYISVEVSMLDITKNKEIKTDIKYYIVGIAVILCINCFIGVILAKRSWLFQLLFTFLIAVFSVVSYLTYLLHGVPFTFSDFKNMKTALAVVKNYGGTIFHYNIVYVVIIVTFIINIILCLFLKHVENMAMARYSRMYYIVGMITSLIICLVGFTKVIPIGAVNWSMVDAIWQYGYLDSLIAESIAEIHPIVKPDDYDVDKLEGKYDTYVCDIKSEKKPDIIVILNESFYDLNQIMDLDNSEEPISVIPSLDNAITGYAVSPNQCGGTNLSEYELLTSNSLAIFSDNITPFQAIDMDKANSIVSVMENRGYTSLGAHNSDSTNYNRNVAYKAMGFDNVYFIDDFENIGYYGNRWYATDYSSYFDIEKWYEEMGNNPRLVYFLTIQNHSPYDMNSDEMNYIKVNSEYPEYNNLLSEYNTSICMSDKAFGALTDYFKTVDRDVIVIMVGDHSPYFVAPIMKKYYPQYDKQSLNLDIRRVPYIIWANKPNLLEDKHPDTVSMNYLLPVALDDAGISLSGYYSLLANMCDEIPIITKYGIYYNNKDMLYNYDDENEYRGVLSEYFNLEYANIKLDLMDNRFFR